MKQFSWVALSLTLGVFAVGVFTPPLAGQGRPVRTNWMADGRSLVVGDIVTVMIDEQILASANVSRMDARQKDSNQGLDGGGGLGFGLRTVSDEFDRRRGENTRRDVFTARMSVRVVEMSPDGRLFRVEGQRTMMLDDHEQTLTLSGWVRSRDVNSANVIASSRLADAQLLYKSNGVLGQPAQGIIAKLLGIIF